MPQNAYGAKHRALELGSQEPGVRIQEKGNQDWLPLNYLLLARRYCIL